MIIRTLAAVAALSLFARPALADALSYDDPGMHFRAPDGWQRLDLNVDPSDRDDSVPVAVFVLHDGQRVKRSITITIQPFDGTLSAFANQRQQDIRQASSDSGTTFILKKSDFSLDNGMPATQIKWTLSSDRGTMQKCYEDLIIDGQRSIDVKYSGDASDVDDADAKLSLASLYVVAYPRRHGQS